MKAKDKRTLVALMIYGAIDPLRFAENESGIDSAWDAFFAVSKLPQNIDAVREVCDRLREDGWLADCEDDDIRVSAWTWASIVHGKSIPDATTILSGHADLNTYRAFVDAEVARRKQMK